MSDSDQIGTTLDANAKQLTKALILSVHLSPYGKELTALVGNPDQSSNAETVQAWVEEEIAKIEFTDYDQIRSSLLDRFKRMLTDTMEG